MLIVTLPLAGGVTGVVVTLRVFPSMSLSLLRRFADIDVLELVLKKSSTAFGASLTEVTVTVTVATFETAPLISFTEYVKVVVPL